MSNKHYGTITEFENYLSLRNKTAYSHIQTLSEDEKTGLLLNASLVIDSNRFIGLKKDKEQYLEFPRVVVSKKEVETNWGLIEEETSRELDISRVEEATYETAYSLSITKKMYETNSDNEGIQTESLDGVGSFTYFESKALKELSGYDIMPLVTRIYLDKYISKSNKRGKVKTRLGVQF